MDFAAEVQFIDVAPQNVAVDAVKGRPVALGVQAALSGRQRAGVAAHRGPNRPKGAFHAPGQGRFRGDKPIHLGSRTGAVKGEHPFGFDPMRHRKGHGDFGLVRQVEQGMGAELVVTDPAKAPSRCSPKPGRPRVAPCRAIRRRRLRGESTTS